MTTWSQRPGEERALLNQGFCGMLLWHASGGYQAIANDGLPIEVAFLVLPLVLHRKTREALPTGVSTSLPVWLDQHPLVRARFPDRAQMLTEFTREALLFGGVHRFLIFSSSLVTASATRRKFVNAVLKT